MAGSGAWTACILAALVMAGFADGASVGLDADSDVHVDLHALCESLARKCWDLDPAAFGMTPVDAHVFNGTLAGADWQAGLELGARLLGHHVSIGVRSNGSVSTGGTDREDAHRVPCLDPMGCPDLFVDPKDMVLSVRLDERTFAPDDCAVVENATQPGHRRLLRFTLTTPNQGVGDLVIGDPNDHPHWFEWGDCHDHWHFREYADYRLWDVTGYAAWQTIRAAYPAHSAAELLEAFPELKEHFQAGHKQGFCVIDVKRMIPGFVVKPSQYTRCETNQGISVSWADSYNLLLDGQWVDVTDVEPGPYFLEAEVNPERLYVEGDYVHNSAAIVVHVT